MEFFRIPKRCEVSRVIPKNHFYEHGDLSSSEKEFFSKAIERIRWEYSIKNENMNIPSYHQGEYIYDEIEFFSIELREKKYWNKVSKLIDEMIPYPIVMVFSAEDEILISTTVKRIHNEKPVLDEIVATEWQRDSEFLKTLDISNFNSQNIFLFQKSIIDRIKANNISITTGTEIDVEKLEDNQSLLKEIELLSQEIEELKTKRKKETQVNRVAELQVELVDKVREREKKVFKLKN
ncbi:MAG: DUF4391 domain-containing protein [Cetobacterium sp.]|uniref:DUF4391 domain-containing protein n=1 Tax=Cetobacterium sp. TaxID=2071632 RepID=UPI002FC836DB